jgi:hypothetical protein
MHQLKEWPPTYLASSVDTTARPDRIPFYVSREDELEICARYYKSPCQDRMDSSRSIACVGFRHGARLSPDAKSERGRNCFIVDDDTIA